MNQKNNTYKVLGVMSGTSLDGLDLCLVNFMFDNSKWNFKILKAATLDYSKKWKSILLNCEDCSGKKLIENHFKYGKYIGKKINSFLKSQEFPDLIASHGHTIFHQTKRGYTFQLGYGGAICATTGIRTVSDFRSYDVALTGEGAPLVPFGDEHLFSDFDCCINLGGFINFSFRKDNRRLAYDICPINIVLNNLMETYFNCEFDHGGERSASGTFNETLFNRLNKLEFYHQSGPKSLGKEWVLKHVFPLLQESYLPVVDQLNTFTRHVAHQLANTLKKENLLDSKILITGGGVKNSFFMSLLKKEKINFMIPPVDIVDYKEALIFGFLGLKANAREINTFASVTGAAKDSIGGVIHNP